jgi:M6 family metalloprotease-like protein
LKTPQSLTREQKDYLEPIQLDFLSSDSTQETSLQAPVRTTGPQTTIVILVNFQDQPTLQPWTADLVRETTFSKVSNQFFESSYGQSTVTGDVVGWYTLPMNTPTTCDGSVYYQIASEAQTLATSNGVALQDYAHQVYVFPKVTSCGWAGLGTVGNTWGGYTQAWINGRPTVSVIGHELGHNLGLYHSNGYYCGSSSPIGSSCTTYEYADPADIMGNVTSAHFNAFQKERLGWLSPTLGTSLSQVDTSGTYLITPFEDAVPGAKGIKILKEKLSDGSEDYYYLEFRQPLGFDSGLSMFDEYGGNLTHGVLVHMGNNVDENSSYLLDMIPSTGQFYDSALGEGKTFSDAAAAQGGVTITVNSITPAGASVTVQFGEVASRTSCQ